VLDARELDLKLALAALRALREDLEDEVRAVVDRNLPASIEVALLHRRERVVEDDDVRARALDALGDLVGLAGADAQCGIRTGTTGGDAIDRVETGREGQLDELLERGKRIGVGGVEGDADEQRLDGSGDGAQLSVLS